MYYDVVLFYCTGSHTNKKRRVNVSVIRADFTVSDKVTD